MIQEIENRRGRALREKIEHYKPSGIYASQISSCQLQMVWNITKWEQKELWDEHVQALLDAGKAREREIIRELLNLGIQVVEGQSKFEEKAIGVVGRYEGKIKLNEHKLLFEIKATSPNVWQSIANADDLWRKWWTRKYIYQMQLYLFGMNEEGMILILDDSRGHWKLIPILTDYEIGEWVFKQCEEVKKHIETETEPEPIDYDADICGNCPFQSLCPVPISFGEGARPVPDDVAEKLARYEKIKDMAQEAETLRKELTRAFEGHEVLLAGNYTVSGRWVEIKGRHQEAKEIPPRRYWKWQVVKLDK